MRSPLAKNQDIVGVSPTHMGGLPLATRCASSTPPGRKPPRAGRAKLDLPKKKPPRRGAEAPPRRGVCVRVCASSEVFRVLAHVCGRLP